LLGSSSCIAHTVQVVWAAAVVEAVEARRLIVARKPLAKPLGGIAAADLDR
jgi:hypothetical protein